MVCSLARPLNALECHTGRLRRTVWDGAQELGEIQVPLDSTSYWERDTGAYPVGYELQSGTSATGDPNPLYGQVLYGPGVAVDQPLSVTRFNYTDKPSASAPATTWPTVTLLPGWDARGVPVFGLFSGTLAGARAYQAGPTQASCPGLATTTPDRCLRVQWPAGQSAYDQQRGRTERMVWHGTVLEGKREGTGLEYKRHRYYDPTTGRFTQPDPIGLAGGLNLYGFANGDPVNFSDPFGLCPAARRDRNGNCPGGLTVREWRQVETQVRRMTASAGDRTTQMLEGGRIHGASLPSDITGRTGTGPLGETKSSDPDMLVNRDYGLFRRSIFNDDNELLKTLLHEGKHVDQMRSMPADYRYGPSGWWSVNRDFFETRARQAEERDRVP